MIFWGDTISIIARLFKVNDKTIAQKLNISSSMLSRIKTGERNISHTPEEIYKRIFDLNAKESLASFFNTENADNKEEFAVAVPKDVLEARQRKRRENREKSLLSDLRTIIESEYPNVKNDLEDSWDEEDYKTFVMGLLSRTWRNISRNNKSKYSDNIDKAGSVSETPMEAFSVESEAETNITQEDGETASTSEASVDDSSTEVLTEADTAQEDEEISHPQASDIWDRITGTAEVCIPSDFYNAYAKYEIEGFVELDPMNLVDINYITAKERPDGDRLIRNAMNFVKHMDEAMKRVEITGYNELICIDINNYIEALREYINFLLKNSSWPDVSPFTLNPADFQGVERKIIRINEGPEDYFWEYDPEEYRRVLAEFECEATEHRAKLRSLYEKVKDVHSRWGGLEIYAYFPGL